jgi:apolipoprotein N-acyltransferase
MLLSLIKFHYRSLVSGLLLGLVMAPFEITAFLVFGIVAIFFYDIEKSETFGDVLRKSFLFGLMTAISALNWIAFNTVPGYLFMAILHPWTYILFAIAYYILFKRYGHISYLFLPILWGLLEWMRSWGQLRFPWINLYYALSYMTTLVQFADIAGGLFFSVVIIAINFSLLYLWKNRGKKTFIRVFLISAAGLVAVFGSLYWYGNSRVTSLRNETFPLMTVAFVQPDIDAYEKWRPQMVQLAIDRLLANSDSLINAGIDLMVWPETAIPKYIRSRQRMLLHFQEFFSERQTPLLTGIPDYSRASGKHKAYNAAWLLHPDSSALDVYYKHFLVPGGETVPFKNYIPALAEINVGGGNFWPGTELKTLNHHFTLYKGTFMNNVWQIDSLSQPSRIAVHMNAAICYESVFPELLREINQKHHSHLLAIITNDGWYGNTAGPYQHFQAAVFRSIELRRSIVRAANNGVSAFFDMTGYYFDKTTLFTTAAHKNIIPIVQEKTIYSQYGYTWLWILFALSLLVLLLLELYHKPKRL